MHRPTSTGPAEQTGFRALLWFRRRPVFHSGQRSLRPPGSRCATGRVGLQLLSASQRRGHWRHGGVSESSKFNALLF